MAYDLIVVGSGNGACGFLSHYLQANTTPELRVLVLEEGEHFFFTSDIATQLNLLRSFAEGKIFKLHNALTPNHRPIISGRACTMGGGGSINATMIHESSDWLADHLGYTADYWTALKHQLNPKFKRPTPADQPSPITRHILQVAQAVGFEISQDAIANIPNHSEAKGNWLHLFTTQFNPFGQRTHSGVSLVDWSDPRLELKTQYRVKQLEFAQTTDTGTPCVAVHAQSLTTRQIESFPLAEGGRVILCAGAATPRLLLPHRERLHNDAIGQEASDHILLPLGLYLVDPAIETTPKDNYIPLFATTMWHPAPEGRPILCTFDFFAGELDRLIFLVAHMFLALLLPNWLKRVLLRFPLGFTIVKNTIRVLIQVVNFIIDLGWWVLDILARKPLHSEVRLVTAIIKFNPAVAGHYVQDRDRITLNFFAEDGDPPFNQDKAVAKTVIKAQMALLDQLGHQPHWLVRCLLRWLTSVPYEADQVDRYVEVYSRKFLLSEQHMAGGCLSGTAVDQGQHHPLDTGKVHGTTNVHVADLSSVPLPRVSPQMTAYLIGFHVAQRLCGGS